MKINMSTLSVPITEVAVGNVYPMQGGWSRKAGHLMIVLAITETTKYREGGTCLMLVIDKDGNPVDVTKYGISGLEDRAAIAYVDGINDALLNMRSL